MQCLEEEVNCALKRGLQREAGVGAKGHRREYGRRGRGGGRGHKKKMTLLRRRGNVGVKRGKD